VFDSALHPGGYQSGLGLTLIRQRLELLYRDCYQLEIRPTGNIFKVECTIRLKEHELYHH